MCALLYEILTFSRKHIYYEYCLGYFVPTISASGCPDMAAPAHAWYKREDDTAVIGCETSQNTWHLTCEEGVWAGVVGNCSEPGEFISKISHSLSI